MRVGIVSQFSNENLGNKLQNYALQQVLRDYADEVITVINKPAAKMGWITSSVFCWQNPCC